MKAVRPVRLELTLPAGATLVGGKQKQEIGHLEGRSNKLEVASFGDSPTDNRGKAEWLIHAPQGGTLTLSAIAERGGTIRRQIELCAVGPFPRSGSARGGRFCRSPRVRFCREFHLTCRVPCAIIGPALPVKRRPCPR